MRKPFLLSLLVALLTTLSTHAYDFQSGDLCYKITSDTTVEVTYQEQWSSANYQGLTTATIPETVTNNGTTYSVTGIGESAFYWCSSLTSITIPYSVTGIGESAFYWCSSLTSITIPENVKHIGGGVFYNCTGLTSVVWNAINCSNDVGDGSGRVWHIFKNSNAHITSFTIGEKVEVIPHMLCYGLSELTSITIPKSVKTVGSYAFRDCSGLTAIGIPENVSTIYGAAFQGCTNITSIAIPQKVRLISAYTFADCVNLSTVELPNEIDTIGRFAFSGCSSLTGFSLPSATTIIGTGCFYNCSNLTSLLLPENVTTVNDSAFYGCSALTSITIPTSVTSIGGSAFGGCTSLPVEDNLRYADTYLVEAVDESLSTYTIKTGTKWIGNNAFYGISSLTSITIPYSVMSIGYDAFYDCSSLADIYCYATTPPACDESFVGVSKHCRIHVPAGTLEAYQWAPEWSDFYHFYEISELPDGAPTDQVGVTVTGNYATFSWPVNPTASSYTLTITKDGEVFCTLIFNNMGQLVGMAFAPARNGEQSANQGDAQSTAYGFSFVVTNLDANSHYTYTFTVNGADNEVIETCSGAFDTTEETTALSETEQENKPSRKIIRNGQVVILRNGETYDMMGQRM